jgi:hypothetical protein
MQEQDRNRSEPLEERKGVTLVAGRRERWSMSLQCCVSESLQYANSIIPEIADDVKLRWPNILIRPREVTHAGVIR